MKKFLLLVCIAIISLNVAAEDRLRHLVSVGTDGVGWSGIGTNFDWNKKKSGVKDQNVSKSNLKLNYAYIFESKVMIGTEIFYEGETAILKDTSGKFTTEESTSTLALFVGYNFNDDLLSSWWIKAALGSGKIETKNKSPLANTDRDYGVGFFTIEGGKRFKLFSNVTYSPSMAITSSSYSKDADKAGLKSSSSAVINLIKFDVLF